MRVALATILVLAGLLAGCGDDSFPFTTVTTVAPTGDGGTISASASCDYYDVDGCTLFGLVLVDPLPTADALARVADLGGVPIAVWRTDLTCISRFSMPVGPSYGVPSRFAYVDADKLRERILAAEGSVAPPITGLDSWNTRFLSYLEEWSKAQEPGVFVEAVAVYLPDSMASALAQDPRFREVVPLSSWRTDTVDSSYAGELMVNDSPTLSQAPDIVCE